MYSKKEFALYKKYVESVRNVPDFMYIKKNDIYVNRTKEYYVKYNKNIKTLSKIPKKEKVGEYNEY